MGQRGTKATIERDQAAAWQSWPSHARSVRWRTAEVAVPDVPAHLSFDARKEWRRITVELESVGLISRLDRAALAIYCQTWGALFWPRKPWPPSKSRRRDGGLDEAEAVFTQQTPTGFVRESALFRVVGKLQQDCDRYLASFGMSPSSRSRVKASVKRHGDPLEEAQREAWNNL